MQLVRASAVRALPKLEESRQCLVKALLDEADTVRTAAAEQLGLLFPAVADLTISQRCAVIQASASTPALSGTISQWFASIDAQSEAVYHGTTSPVQQELLGVCGIALDHPDDPDLQAVSKAIQLVSSVMPVQNEGVPPVPGVRSGSAHIASYVAASSAITCMRSTLLHPLIAPDMLCAKGTPRCCQAPCRGDSGSLPRAR